MRDIQYTQEYQSEVKKATVNDFSLGLVKDLDVTTINDRDREIATNSLYETLNVDINRRKGVVSKRRGIGLTTELLGSFSPNEKIVDVFEFTGGDNKLIQIVTTITDDPAYYKLYYRVGTSAYAQMPTCIDDAGLLTIATDTSINLDTLTTKPFIEARDGVCRIGLGKELDPIILYYNKRIKWFENIAYSDGTEEDGVVPNGSASAPKGWYIRRQSPLVGKGLTPWAIVVQPQTPVVRMPSCTLTIPKPTRETKIEFKFPSDTERRWPVMKMQIDFKRSYFEYTTDTDSKSLLYVGLRPDGYPEDFDYTAAHIANKIHEAFTTVSIAMGDKSFTNIYNVNTTSTADEIKVTFTLKGWTTADASLPAKKAFVGMYYFPQAGGQGSIQTAAGGWLAWATVDPVYSEDVNSALKNPSIYLPVGTYEFKFTLMFGTEETIPLRGTYKVTTQTIMDKIGVRIAAATNRILFDPRVTRINIYLKRTIPITANMSDFDKNLAAKYTDIDYRLVDWVDLIKQQQFFEDTLRKNDASDTVYGSIPALWQVSGANIYIDYIYSDLLSGSNKSAGTGQENAYGFLADRLKRDWKDEGVVRYSGSVEYKGRRFLYGCKKELDITKVGEADNTIEFSDRIYYTLITENGVQNDLTSNDTWISNNDNDAVMAIKGWRDKLLVFTQRSMCQIDIDFYKDDTVNMADEVVVLDTFLGCGLDYPGTLVSTDLFLAWANRHSVYVFTGEQPVDALKGKWRNLYKTLTLTGAFASYCHATNSYWLCIGSVIYILNMEDNCWTYYIFNDTITFVYRSITNRFYLFVWKECFSFPTDKYYDQLSGSQHNYLTYIQTQQIFSDSSTDKQFQHVIFSHAAQLPSTKFTVSNVSTQEIRMRQFGDRVPVKPIPGQSIQVEVWDRSNGSFEMECIDIYYTEVDQVRRYTPYD